MKACDAVDDPKRLETVSNTTLAERVTATNLVAIQCASSVVLYACGFHKVTQRQGQDPTFARRLVLDGAAFLGLAIFLYVQLAATA